MQITQVKIRNYRSIKDLTIKLDKLNVLCGPNSSGKSNILRILNIAFEDVSQDPRQVEAFVRENLNHSRNSSTASIRIDVTFREPPKSLRIIADQSDAKLLIYSFSAKKSGKITRKLGKKTLNDNSFQELLREFTVIYIPTIRDLENDGLSPFLKLFKRAMNSSNGNREIESHLSKIKQTLSKKADGLLGEQKHLAKNILNAKSIELSPEEINLDHIYNDLKLQIKGEKEQYVPMENIGTGHQSAVIINLYKQLGESTPGKTLYLFEEPDAHLHPPTIRSVGSQILDLSASSQSVISTHSPILISQLGLDKVTHLTHNQESGTKTNKSNLSPARQGEISHNLLKYGLRITETLFAKIVILVEGPSDAIVVGRLIEKVSGKSADQLDIIITPAGGKDNVVEIASILTKLRVKWMAIFDFDAALKTSSIPILNQDNLIDSEVSDEWIVALEGISKELNVTSKRGKKARTQLRLILNEIKDGSPSLTHYDDSSLKQLLDLTSPLNPTKEADLRDSIKRQKVTVLREILEPYNIWLLKPDLEMTLIGRDSSNIDEIIPVIASKLKIKISKSDPGHKRQIANELHKLANNPEALIAITDAVYESRGLSRSNLLAAIKKTIDIVS